MKYKLIRLGQGTLAESDREWILEDLKKSLIQKKIPSEELYVVYNKDENQELRELKHLEQTVTSYFEIEEKIASDPTNNVLILTNTLNKKIITKMIQERKDYNGK